jgi:hypothetical protein
VTDAFKNYLSSHKDVKSHECFVWWCFFNNNQHRMLDKDAAPISTEDLAKTFGTQLKSIGTMVSMLDSLRNPLYTCRIWCVYESFIAQQCGIELETALPDTCRQELDEFTRESGLWGLKVTVDCSQAKASNPADETAIKELIQKQSSFADVNEKVTIAVRECVTQEVIRFLKS